MTTIEFLRMLFGDRAGYVHTAVGLDGSFDENGSYRFPDGDFRPRSFRWPAGAEKAAAKADEDGDIYVVPYLLKGTKRAVGTSVHRQLLHADIDHGNHDLEQLAALGAGVVDSGRGVHVYIPLTWALTVPLHQRLEEALRDHLGADDKIRDNDYLRLPGSLNRKTDPPTPVKVLFWPETPTDPKALAEALGVDLTVTGNHPEKPDSRGAEHHNSTDDNLHTEKPHAAPEDIPAAVAESLAIVTTPRDRSQDIYRVLGVCMDTGLNLEQSRAIIRTRKDLAEKLDQQKRDLADEWAKLGAERATTQDAFTPQQPPAPAIVGHELLDEIREALTKFVIFPSESSLIATTLWIAATHALPAWQHATRLVIRSPQKRCGKSRLLDVIELLCWHPMASTDASVAVLYRSIGSDDTKTVTLLIDEADALFGTKAKAEQNEDLRSLLNAGFQRGRSVWRCVGPQQEPTQFGTFSMAALAGIKSLPDTIMDRAVIVDLKRRRPGETVSRFRLRRDTAPLRKLRDKTTRWARDKDRLKAMAETEPDMPESVTDRAQDAWEPLIAIADAAGEHWPILARAACEELCSDSEDDAHDVGLLQDIHGILEEVQTPFMRSIQLVAALKDCDESPWRDEDLTPHKLARHLKHFGIKPKPGPGKTARGYYREDFKDTFSRYIRPKVSNRPQNGSDQHEEAEK